MPAALKLASDGGCGGGPSMGGRPLSLPPLAEFRPSKRLHMGTRTTLKNFLSSQPGVNFFFLLCVSFIWTCSPFYSYRRGADHYTLLDSPAVIEIWISSWTQPINKSANQQTTRTRLWTFVAVTRDFQC